MFGPDDDFDRRLAKLRPAERSSSIPVNSSDEQSPKRMIAIRGGPPSRSRDWWSIGRFARFPYRLFGSGLGAALGTSAGWLYVALCDQANRSSSVRFRVTDRTLAANTGLSERTIIDLRKHLAEKGLIEFSVSPGQRPVYELKAIPETDIHPSERPREKRKPRGRSSAKNASEVDDLWGGLPQILRERPANYARPYANSAHPS